MRKEREGGLKSVNQVLRGLPMMDFKHERSHSTVNTKEGTRKEGKTEGTAECKGTALKGQLGHLTAI